MAQLVVRQPYPNDCHRYYEKSLWSCPPNFYWNDQLKRCQLQPIGGCSFNDSSQDSGSSSVIETYSIPSICDKKVGQLIPYPGDCTHFIHCDYLPFVKTCPQYLFWNSRLQTCDKICV
ncbi:peritrophin-1 [Drosophila serrata]|uniref:peritrophin-1 n=1 Tax=Drosophila serrata TaxID=7274 RepID=UPI000A1D18D3|nr:peritrophin-1 [Drosophila serrata]